MSDFRRVPVGEVTLRVALQGQGPLVVMVHGFPESWYSWRHQMSPIAGAGFTACAIDVRGYGGSDKPHEVEAYSLERLSGDVAGLIAALSPDQPAVVIGHDWGAPVAWTTALVHPDRVRAVAGLLTFATVKTAFARSLETNFFGPLQLTKAFASTLAANGGSAVLNVLSIASWVTSPQLAIYSASKAAAWALTNALRHELRGQGTQVLGMHVGFVDTDLTRGLDIPKSAPDVVVGRTLDALEAGAEEVLADEEARQVKAGLAAVPSIYLVSPSA